VISVFFLLLLIFLKPNHAFFVNNYYYAKYTYTYNYILNGLNNGGHLTATDEKSKTDDKGYFHKKSVEITLEMTREMKFKKIGNFNCQGLMNPT